jgi:CRISPR-associated exonuclease Cas4
VEDEAAGSVQLPGRAGWWRPFPVEYKRGRRKADSCDEVQLCAQALCLEEMLSPVIESGALYYGTTRRRCDVTFSAGLRAETEELARRMHALNAAGRTPRPEYGKKCESCSLLDRCAPHAVARRSGVARYLAGALREEERKS